ncbi:MAG: hypothetical protein D6714_16910 [Bacteroidetes bacterium]|nr:MAG: hypothetical protein D6714_16910 [Bacteroidota bacterium]
MNLLCTRCFSGFFLTLCFPVLLFADPGKGYLITLDGHKLTGQVHDILFSAWQTRLRFENDFGDVYAIHPATIYGFVFENDGHFHYYESKFLGGTWAFLEVEKRGEALSLYRNPRRKLRVRKNDGEPYITQKKASETWLQFNGKRPFRIYRLGYKKILRQNLSEYPELADLIGQKGYRFRDLPRIVELYNEWAGRLEKRL